ncbi:Piso0_005047 [Millerozyma farinosa CBS 7064]|uniref:Piso0_005047 protein n=1 Tax=Pichia sorbitophila (strain ATCC MYA-4447 / BCRC 22081 / CBS 7064 / NBRC 10061 / NRRL Y-12695) TaxID=559304 RepID=G8Y433_PICSO|nr:Piso0_005047 [Millerozyma farinosa CBS 7064]
MSDLTPPFSVKSIYEYKSDHDDDLAFPAGVVITVTDIEDDDWYSGELNGKTGIFPKNFVKVLDSTTKPSRPSESIIGKGTPELQHSMGSEPPVAESSPLIPLADEESSLKSTSVKSDVEEGKVPETGSTEKAKAENTIRSPIPELSAKKQNDSYNIKKQFLASGKSSYIPPIKPRDESNLVGHMRQDVVDGQDIVKSTDYSEHKKEDVGPKLTLKERISLLQQQQKEQAEREAAGLKRQQERKQKLAEQKEKLQHEKQATSPLEHTEETNEKHAERQDSGRKSIESETSGSPKQEEFVPASVEHSLSHKDASAQAAEKDIAEEGNPDGEGSDAEGASEDEYLRRKRLVERMAKISGGRNMFGMMGINPPFAPSAKEEDKSQAPDEDEQVEEEKEEEAEVQPTRAQAVPIMPFANPDALPKSLANKLNPHHNDDDDDGDGDSYEFQDTKEVIHREDPDVTAPNADPKEKTMEQEESFSRSKDSANESFEEALGDEEKTDPKPLNYEDAAGYEADEDLSDKPKNDNFASEPSKRELNEELSTSAHPSPARPPPTGPPPMGPPPVMPPRAAPPVPNVHRVDPQQHEDDTRFHQDEEDSKFEKADVNDPNAYPESDSSEEANTRQEHHFRTIPPPVPPVPALTDSRTDELDADLGHTKEIDQLHGSSFPTRSSTLPELHASRGAGHAHPSGPGEAPKIPPPIPQANIDSIKRSSTELPPAPHRKSIDTISSKKSHHTESGISPLGEKPLSHVDSSDAMKGRSKSHAQSQAEVTLSVIEYEIANISENSSWWLKGNLPEPLTSKIGSELIYEVDTNEIIKRGKRSMTYKDYYVLFYDLSQIVLEVEYETEDPRTTVRFSNNFAKPSPIIRKDLLDRYYHEFGGNILTIASSLVNSKINDNLVKLIFGKLTKTNINLLKNIGNKSYGVTIYKNMNNQNIARIDEIRPGDILCIRQAKFANNKGLSGITNRSINVGTGDEPLAAVITDYDSKKDKFKVIEQDASGHIKKESYKITDMKSGKIRVFRVVGRDYIEW